MLTSEQITRFKDNLSNVSVVSLLIANTLPIFGVLFMDWDAFAIVLLYWTENAVIGFYNILKMALVRMPHPVAHLGKLFTIFFFLIHYGGFTAIHGFFVLEMFHQNTRFPVQHSWPCFLVFVQMLFNVIGHVISILPPNMMYAIAGLFISHGISFGYHFLYKGEYTRTGLQVLMGQPYGRIVVMHVAVLFGGFLTMALGSPIGVLLILVLLKTVIDVKLHLRQHRAKPQSNPE
ncbi:MAG: DUF6498-containing protein [Planctomycetales bacterium]|nr:DUF6498-containing protein [Planctomycetales bacterium]